MLGDLNVDERHLGELGQLSDIAFVVSGVPTNTGGNKTYDNLIYNRQHTAEYTGAWGVFDLEGEFQLTQEQVEVSDHLPVWAEFTRHIEGGATSVARGPGGTR